MAAADWNSLEVAKLLVGISTPALVAFLAFWLNGRLTSLEAAQWARQKIVERRIAAYDDLAPDLNKLYCFFGYIGGWKEWTPPEIVSLNARLTSVPT